MADLVEGLKEDKFIEFKTLMAEGELHNGSLRPPWLQKTLLYGHWIIKMLEYLRDKVT